MFAGIILSIIMNLNELLKTIIGTLKSIIDWSITIFRTCYA